MNAEALRRMLTRRPFEPFELHMTHGEVVPIYHPEMAWLIGGRIYVHQPVSDSEIICSLLHIATITPIRVSA